MWNAGILGDEPGRWDVWPETQRPSPSDTEAYWVSHLLPFFLRSGGSAGLGWNQQTWVPSRCLNWAFWFFDKTDLTLAVQFSKAYVLS